MAKLALIYGMRLPALLALSGFEGSAVKGFPAEELKEVREAIPPSATAAPASPCICSPEFGLEGSVEDIRRQFDQSIAAFFDIYPEI